MASNFDSAVLEGRHNANFTNDDGREKLGEAARRPKFPVSELYKYQSKLNDTTTYASYECGFFLLSDAEVVA